MNRNPVHMAGLLLPFLLVMACFFFFAVASLFVFAYDKLVEPEPSRVCVWPHLHRLKQTPDLCIYGIFFPIYFLFGFLFELLFQEAFAGFEMRGCY